MRAPRAALIAAPIALLLAGCTPTVALTPAPGATSTACAAVVVRLPQTVAGAARRVTDAQGTAAWGDPAVTLVCGGTRPPSDRCFPIDGVDWTTRNERLGGRDAVVLTTFGRDPVVQVVNPVTTSRTTPGISANDVLLDVTDAVREGTRATGERCGVGGPTSASPSARPRPTITHGPGPG